MKENGCIQWVARSKTTGSKNGGESCTFYSVTIEMHIDFTLSIVYYLGLILYA